MKTNILLFVLILLPLSTGAQWEIFLAGQTVESVINQTKEGVKEVIREIKDSVSSTSFQIRQHGQLLLDQLDAILQANVDKTFGELRDTEQQLFIDVREQIENLKTLENIAASDVKQITNNLATAMGNVPFSRTTPRVLEYDPYYVLSKLENQDGAVSINIMGFLLADGIPSLELANKSCSLKIKIDTRLSFSCPINIFTTDDSIDYVHGILKIYEKPGFFSQFWKEPEEFVYNISVNVIPRVFGTYVMIAYVDETKILLKEREQRFKHRNAHCQGSRDKDFNFYAENEWAIDPKSIDLKCNKSRRSSCNGLRNVLHDSFQYNCTIANSGYCFWPAKDARGGCSGKVTWTEKKPAIKRVEKEVEQGQLEWNKDVALRLPTNTKAIELTIEQNLDPNRKQKSIFFVSDNKHNWYEVEVNFASQYTRIRTRNLNDAMRIR